MLIKPQTKVLTLFFVFKDASWKEVLLGFKKRGFGAGKFNGFGGKVEKEETIRTAAIRELHEESGLIVEEDDMRQVGRIHFEFVGDPVWLDVNVFTSHVFKGDVSESDEMRPQWFSTELTKLPFDSMWLDDKYWMPFLLAKVPFFGYFQFLGHDKVLRYTIKQLDGFHDSDFQDSKIPWYNNPNEINDGRLNLLSQ